MMNDQENSSLPLNEDMAHKLLRFLESSPVTNAGRRSLQNGPGFGENCPNEESYMKLALGSVPGKDADALLAHATVCDDCGQTLKLYLEAMEGTPSSEELAAIAEIASMQERWQQELTRKLAATHRRRQTPFPRTPQGWFGVFGAIAALVLCTVLLILWQNSRHSPDHQLALAYSEDRTLELRIPGASWAKYSPPTHTRGNSADQEPAALLDARAGLARDLERSPQNPRLLEFQARADVLNEKYDAAVDVLDRLIATGPVTAELLTDAAMAYFERGVATGSQLDRSTALDYVRRADELTPTDPVVLFNEGIVMEDQGQVMNAVEVWNRYLTVERDSKWAAEGKRRLDALEQTLNRLKSHQSRIDQLLATPASMDALAADASKLASLDEELATYELDKILLAAFPMDGDPATNPQVNGQATRASPCGDSCQAARRLLKALGHSLEIQHQDPWLTDLISLDIDKLSAQEKGSYSQALRLFARALRENLKIEGPEGEKASSEAAEIFHRLVASGSQDAAFLKAVRVGELRTSLERMLGLQIQVDFTKCRDFARSKQDLWKEDLQYPWIRIVKMSTDINCYGTPDMRLANERLISSALLLAESDKYFFLTLRIKLRMADAAQDAGDMETSNRLVVEQVKLLESRDSPVIRVTQALGILVYDDERVVGVHTTELSDLEYLRWLEIGGPRRNIPLSRMELARLFTRTGQIAEAERQSRLAYEETGESNDRYSNPYILADAELKLAELLLEHRDLNGAQVYLLRATSRVRHYSEPWGLRRFAETRGQLKIEKGDFKEATKDLEGEILRSEGRNTGGESSVSRSEFAEQDHDLYAELAAAWLAEGHPADEVLALWERFRMRSHDLAITTCGERALNCDLSELKVSLRQLGNNVVVGQIILLDRILIYRADRNGVTWQEKRFQRQDILAAGRTFERALSSPTTSMETATVLGTGLQDALLPGPVSHSDQDSLLLIEPDPLLRNFPWPALPTSSGPLGIVAPIAEIRSLLAIKEFDSEEFKRRQFLSFATERKQALVIAASMPTADEVPLPEVIKEAQSVNDLLRAPAPLIGPQANSSNITARIASATIFHFAGHAVQRNDGTELLLAASSRNDRQPWIDGEFFREHPPRSCRLAVLSACATGSHESSWNHPFQDIVESLASAGVNDVVATRWQIDSDAAVPFMNVFYSSVAQGNNIPVALMSARRVLSSHSLYKNPYYWAAYFVTSGQIPSSTGGLYGRRQESKQYAEEVHR